MASENPFRVGLETERAPAPCVFGDKHPAAWSFASDSDSLHDSQREQ